MGMLAGIALAVASAVVLVAIVYTRSIRARLRSLEPSLTERQDPATNLDLNWTTSQGGRLGGRVTGMAVVADDLRVGADAVRRELRSFIAYATGTVLIAGGIVFRDHLPYRGTTIMSIGAVFILAAIFVPYVTERLRPDITGELAEVEAAWHAGLVERDRRFAEELDGLREVVVGIRGQLR